MTAPRSAGGGPSQRSQHVALIERVCRETYSLDDYGAFLRLYTRDPQFSILALDRFTHYCNTGQSQRAEHLSGMITRIQIGSLETAMEEGCSGFIPGSGVVPERVKNYHAVVDGVATRQQKNAFQRDIQTDPIFLKRICHIRLLSNLIPYSGEVVKGRCLHAELQQRGVSSLEDCEAIVALTDSEITLRFPPPWSASTGGGEGGGGAAAAAAAAAGSSGPGRGSSAAGLSAPRRGASAAGSSGPGRGSSAAGLGAPGRGASAAGLSAPGRGASASGSSAPGRGASAAGSSAPGRGASATGSNDPARGASSSSSSRAEPTRGPPTGAGAGTARSNPPARVGSGPSPPTARPSNNNNNNNAQGSSTTTTFSTRPTANNPTSDPALLTQLEALTLLRPGGESPSPPRAPTPQTQPTSITNTPPQSQPQTQQLPRPSFVSSNQAPSSTSTNPSPPSRRNQSHQQPQQPNLSFFAPTSSSTAIPPATTRAQAQARASASASTSFFSSTTSSPRPPPPASPGSPRKGRK